MAGFNKKHLLIIALILLTVLAGLWLFSFENY